VGNFQRRPPDYKPSLEFNVRKSREGGGVRNPGLTLPNGGPVPSRRETLVLAHGFNNNEQEAAEAFIGYRVGQYSTFGNLSPGSLDRLLADAFWPGDADWGWFDFAEPLIYGKSVSKAKDSAAVLARQILALPNLETVSFLGHSLGCRVVLETVERLLDAGRPAIGRICLMAPAVPVEMVSAGGRFDGVLRKLQGLHVKIRVLHSTDDGVLAGAFVPGQASAGPKEASLRALGRKGPPQSMPGLGDNVSHQQIYGAAHSDYWGHKVTEPSLHALKDSGGFFGFNGPSREIGKRPIR
jgi:pimeloyl-ACP methyl ester carboxylesterase